MKRTAKRILVAASVAAVTFQSIPTASACGGRGSRIARPAGSYGHPATIYRQPAPSYRSTRYVQPYYSQPQQVVTPQPVAPTTVAGVQPRPRAQVAVQNAIASQATPIQNTASRQPTAQQATAQTVTTQSARTQPARTQSVASTPAASKPATTADPELSALAALASIASQSTATQPAETQAAATQPAATQVPAAQSSSNPQAGVSQSGVPQFSAAAVPASSNSVLPVGSFTATLPSKVSIQLSLTDNGTFSWVVRSNGKTTQFSGQYRVTEGRLTLVRSNDLQQMAGKLTLAQNGFTFKLDGSGNGGLDFKKA